MCDSLIYGLRAKNSKSSKQPVDQDILAKDMKNKFLVRYLPFDVPIKQ